MIFYLFQERPRPEYVAKCDTYEKNPITGIKEPYFPKRERMPRIISGLGVVIMMVRHFLQFYFLFFLQAIIDDFVFNLLNEATQKDFQFVDLF